MEITELSKNVVALEREIDWFKEVLDQGFKLYFQNEADVESITEILPPSLEMIDSIYAELIQKYEMNFAERFVLLMTLCPHVKPEALDLFFIENSNTKRGFSEFGGLNGASHSGFLPTGETAVFILAGDRLEKRLELIQMFSDQHFFAKNNILRLHRKNQDEPLLSGQLVISSEFLTYFTTGAKYQPDYASNFPAKKIATPLNWEDLVLDEFVRDEVHDIVTWIKHGKELLYEWQLHKKIKRGYRALFYGPPGTGKTLTATLVGKALQLDVYHIDLSMIVSKYIGETEKNLANVFDQAENKDWILFFDEADALFGKRSQGSSSNDRHANQEIAYLLQRIEDFPGVIILASNLKGNLDEAFTRRFQSMIYFPSPNENQRLELWQNAFTEPLKMDKNVSLVEIAEKYELAGGAIINVLRYCSIKAKQRSSETIFQRDIESGIRKELRKEGKA